MRNLTTFGKILIAFFLLLNIFTVMAEKIDPVFGASLLEEDRFVENGTAIALLVAGLILLFHVWKNIIHHEYLKSIVQLLIVLALIFMGGEEISWGQRIFGWETTGMFAQDNLQKETNFHNLKIGGLKLNKIIFTYAFFAIGFFVFIAAPYFYKRSVAFKNFFNRLGATIPHFRQTLLLLAGLVFTVLLTASRKWELWECNAAMVILWTITEPLNAESIYSNRVDHRLNRQINP